MALVVSTIGKVALTVDNNPVPVNLVSPCDLRVLADNGRCTLINQEPAQPLQPGIWILEVFVSCVEQYDYVVNRGPLRAKVTQSVTPLDQVNRARAPDGPAIENSDSAMPMSATVVPCN